MEKNYASELVPEESYGVSTRAKESLKGAYEAEGKVRYSMLVAARTTSGTQGY